MVLYERFLEWKKHSHKINDDLDTICHMKFACMLAMLYHNIDNREEHFNLLIYDDMGIQLDLIEMLHEIFPNMHVIVKMFYRNNIYEFFSTSFDREFPKWMEVYIVGQYTKIHEGQRINSLENEKKFIDELKKYKNIFAYTHQRIFTFAELYFCFNIAKTLNMRCTSTVAKIDCFFRNGLYYKGDKVTIPHSEILPVKKIYNMNCPFNNILIIAYNDGKESSFTEDDLKNIKNYNISNGEIVTFIIEDFVKKYNMKNTAEWYINKLSKIL